MGSVLARNDIQRLIGGQPPLVESYRSLDEQLQPNGFDLTVRDVAMLGSRGIMAVENSRRAVSELAPLVFDGSDNLDLMPGPFIITYNEVVHLPNNVMALGRPRSSVLRCGVSVGTAVWDAGYSGRSQSLMVVHNPLGFRLQRNARVTQLVFFRLSQETEGYRGTYQGENT